MKISIKESVRQKSAGFKVVAMREEASIDDQEKIRQASDYYIKDFVELLK